jgi:hypothetical protein
MWPVGAALPTSERERSGSAYLRQRAASAHVREDVTKGLGEAVRPWCRDVRRLSSAHGARLACLVSLDTSSELERALDEWQQRADGREIHISGPWPPFSFVTTPEARRT